MPSDPVTDLLIRAAASMREEDLEDPEAEQSLRFALDLVDPQPGDLPPNLVERLLLVDDKAERFHQAIQAMGVPPEEGPMRDLADSMVHAGLLAGGMAKSDILEKMGVHRRLHPFNPHKDVSRGEEAVVRNWQAGESDDREGAVAGTAAREAIPGMHPHARLRALSRIASRTLVRQNPETGEHEYLLHRGMGSFEHKNRVSPSEGTVEHAKRSSWTPDHDEARNFAKKGVVSAWVPESHIHHVPAQLGSLGWGSGKNEFHREREVVVHPGKRRLATPDEVQRAQAASDPQKLQPTVHSRVNARGKMKGVQARQEITRESKAFRKSDDLAKEQYKKFPEEHNKAHGWISGEGEYHHLGPSEHHPADPGYARGAITVGHAGDNNAIGLKSVLENHLHPATAKLRELAREHWGGQRMAVRYRDSKESDIGVSADHFARHGLKGAVARERLGKGAENTAPDDRAHQNVWAQGHGQANELQEGSLEPHVQPPEERIRAMEDDPFNRVSVRKSDGLEKARGKGTFAERVEGNVKNLRERKGSGREARPHGSLFTTGEKPSKTLAGAKPHTTYSFGAHWPVVRIASERKAVYLNTHQYGGHTGQLASEVRRQVGKHLPGYKVVEVNHPNYQRTSDLMRGPERDIHEHLREAAEKHPDPKQRMAAAESHAWLTKLRKAKPDKRTAGLGWDEEANEARSMGRLHRALTSLGLSYHEPGEGAKSKRLGREHPASVTHTPDEAPKVQQVVHEAAHAVQAPVGDTLASYQERMGKPGQNNPQDKKLHGGLHPELVAQGAEASISRMAGIKPFRVPRSSGGKEGAALASGKQAVHDRREGITAVHPETGQTVEGKGTHALINLRARGPEGKAEATRRSKSKGEAPARPGSPEEFFGKSGDKPGYNAWRPNSDDDIRHEYEYEYKRHWAHTGLFPTRESFHAAVRSAEPREITPKEDKRIGNRSRTRSLGELKDLVSGYQYPRDVDRISNGLRNNHPMPHPILIRHKGQEHVLGGNTRMDAAFIHGVNPHAVSIGNDKLEKMGVHRRLHPYRPPAASGFEEHTISDWQDKATHAARESMPAMHPNARYRALSRLAAATTVRKNPKSGEREYLLHRGMSDVEHRAFKAPGGYHHTERSSWTPREHEAKAHGARVAHVWMPESHIHHLPMMVGSPSEQGPNEYRQEFEVVAKPGKRRAASKKDLDLSNVHTRTNERGFLQTPEHRQAYLKVRLKKSDSPGDEDASPLMNRFEEKYLLPRENLAMATDELSARLRQGDSDTSVRYNLNRTVYLDNPDMDCFRHALDGAKPRLKARIRSYSPNGEEFEGVSYVELKVKEADGLTRKHRIRVHASEAPCVAEGHEIAVSESLFDLNKDVPRDQLWRRVSVVNSLLTQHGLRRHLEVRYWRRAYSDGKVRVTVDDRLSYHAYRAIEPHALAAIKASEGWAELERGLEEVGSGKYLVMEVKHLSEPEGWIKELLDKCGARKASISKYCLAVAGQAMGKDDGEVIPVEASVAKSEALEKVSDKYLNRVMQGTALIHPATIAGKDTSPEGLPYHATIKVFDHDRDDVLGEGHRRAMSLDMHPPDPSKTTIHPKVLRDRNGDEVHVLELGGDASRIAQHNARFSGLGYQQTYRFTPHLTLDKGTWEGIKGAGHRTAADAGIEFGHAEMRRGLRNLRRY